MLTSSLGQQVQLERAKQREADLRKRMVNVVNAYNVAVEGFDTRTKAVAEKTNMIINRCMLACPIAGFVRTETAAISGVTLVKLLSSGRSDVTCPMIAG